MFSLSFTIRCPSPLPFPVCSLGQGLTFVLSRAPMLCRLLSLFAPRSSAADDDSSPVPAGRLSLLQCRLVAVAGILCYTRTIRCDLVQKLVWASKASSMTDLQSLLHRLGVCMAAKFGTGAAGAEHMRGVFDADVRAKILNCLLNASRSCVHVIMDNFNHEAKAYHTNARAARSDAVVALGMVSFTTDDVEVAPAAPLDHGAVHITAADLGDGLQCLFLSVNADDDNQLC